MYTIAQLKTDLAGRLHGTSLNKVKGPNELIARAGRQLLLDCDPAETRQIQRIAATFFDSVYDHPVPDDLKGNKVIDIRPVYDRQATDNLHQTSSRPFDLNKTEDAFKYTIEHNRGTKFIRLSADIDQAGTLVDACDSLTTPTVWTGTSQIFNLTTDSVTKVSSGSALRFDIDGTGGVGSLPLLLNTSTPGGVAKITGVKATAVDLSTFANVGSFFVWLYVEDYTLLTSVAFVWGSDSSNNYTKTVTTGHAQPFHNGFNLLRFDWFGATRTGSPINTAIDYIELQFVVSGILYNVRVDEIYAKVPKYYEMVYYSKYLFRSSAGAWKETVDSDTDIVNLETDAYNLLLDRAEAYALRQLKQSGVDVDVKSSEDSYKQNVEAYKDNNKSQVDRPRQRYYRPFKPVRIW